MSSHQPRKDREVVPFAVGDTLTMRKSHPCGSNQWRVYRIGADIGMRCLNCGRRIMLDRATVQRRMKSRIPAEQTTA